MLKTTPKCYKCGKEIEKNEEVYVKLRYPKWGGMTEIKAYLQNEGKFFCEKCIEDKV
ncbi:Fe3+ hydroxamate ABC transporter substrate-binding protein [Metabacillus fastidiosus]|uniref:Fe3+ hydroxamate ABC transporter substrate-binding protein n=1 Tax=Metabacillus fastidiosus TaxID=1458 RepID=UPI003D26CBE7